MQLCGIKLMNLKLKKTLTYPSWVRRGGYKSHLSGQGSALFCITVLRCFMVESLPVFVDQYLSVYKLKNYPLLLCTYALFCVSPHSELIKKALPRLMRKIILGSQLSLGFCSNCLIILRHGSLQMT